MINEYNLHMLLIVIISYLLGSIPTAFLVAKTHRIDIFAVGSGNMGATNVSRVLGYKWGLFVLFVDVMKAVVAIFIAQQIKPPTGSIASATTVASISVIIGHNWSLFASMLTGTLRGGKGAATAFGTLFMIAPIQVWLGMVVVGGFIIARTRYVSLAVLTMIAIAVLWITVLTLQQQLDAIVIVYAWALGALIALRFRENIKRLLTGTERRLGERT
ncbi:MAG: glycerol-3-phosphate acyltransferase [Chloroflexota bacterium]